MPAITTTILKRAHLEVKGGGIRPADQVAPQVDVVPGLHHLRKAGVGDGKDGGGALHVWFWDGFGRFWGVLWHNLGCQRHGVHSPSV